MLTLLNPSANILKLHILPTECICFIRIAEQTMIVFLYDIYWLVFVTDGERLLRGADRSFNYCRS